MGVICSLIQDNVAKACLVYAVGFIACVTANIFDCSASLIVKSFGDISNYQLGVSTFCNNTGYRPLNTTQTCDEQIFFQNQSFKDVFRKIDQEWIKTMEQKDDYPLLECPLDNCDNDLCQINIDHSQFKIQNTGDTQTTDMLSHEIPENIPKNIPIIDIDSPKDCHSCCDNGPDSFGKRYFGGLVTRSGGSGGGKEVIQVLNFIGKSFVELFTINGGRSKISPLAAKWSVVGIGAFGTVAFLLNFVVPKIAGTVAKIFTSIGNVVLGTVEIVRKTVEKTKKVTNNALDTASSVASGVASGMKKVVVEVVEAKDIIEKGYKKGLFIIERVKFFIEQMYSIIKSIFLFPKNHQFFTVSIVIVILIGYWLDIHNDIAKFCKEKIEQSKMQIKTLLGSEKKKKQDGFFNRLWSSFVPDSN